MGRPACSLAPCAAGLLALAFASASPAAAVRFSVVAERTRTTLDQPIRVQAVAVSDKDLGALPIPAVPAAEGFSVLRSDRNQSSSSSISITNGRAERKVEITYYFTYLVAPKQLGVFTFPALSLTADGQTYGTQPFTVEVLKEAVRNPDVIVRVRCSKQRLYVGEQAVLTVLLGQKPGASVQITNEGFGALLQGLRSAAGQSFSFVDLTRGKVAASDEMLEGERYTVYRVSFALFPLSAGQLSIKPLPLQYNVLRQARRRGDPFDDFFGGSFFGGVEAQPATVLSNSLSITAAALPPAPADFSGVVGSASLDVDVSPREVPAGGSVTLKVAIRAETRPGSLAELAAPATPDFETFTPEKSTAADTTAAGVVTRRSYKYLLIARKEGSAGVPPVTLTYFDPAGGQYRTLSSAPFTVTVTKGDGEQRPATRYLSQAEIQEVGQDIHFIKTPPRLSLQSGPPYRNPLFYLANLLPFCIALFSLLYRVQRRREQADPSLLLRRRAYGRALAGLGQLEHKSAALKPADFLGRLALALEQYITRTYGFAAAGKTIEELGAALAGAGVDEAVRRRLSDLLVRMDAFRFGGMALAEKERTGLLAAGREVLATLERAAKGAKKT